MRCAVCRERAARVCHQLTRQRYTDAVVTRRGYAVRARAAGGGWLPGPVLQEAIAEAHAAWASARALTILRRAYGRMTRTEDAARRAGLELDLAVFALPRRRVHAPGVTAPPQPRKGVTA